MTKLKSYIEWFIVISTIIIGFSWFFIGNFLPANASMAPSTEISTPAPVPADEEFQIMEYRTMPYQVGKEISKLSGWEIKIILPTKEETWGAIKVEARKLEATCLVKIQEGEAVYFFEDEIRAGYLFIVNAYSRCPTQTK